MRAATLALLLLAACDDDAATPADAGVTADAPPSAACGALLDGGWLHLVVVGDGTCQSCTSADSECAGLAAAIPATCTPYCLTDVGLCLQRCDGEGCTTDPDAGVCAPGGSGCQPPYFTVAGVYQCDPTCGTPGGCRDCVFDSECQRDYGPEAVCQRHCHLCCGGTSGNDCTSCI